MTKCATHTSTPISVNFYSITSTYISYFQPNLVRRAFLLASEGKALGTRLLRTMYWHLASLIIAQCWKLVKWLLQDNCLLVSFQKQVSWGSDLKSNISQVNFQCSFGNQRHMKSVLWLGTRLVLWRFGEYKILLIIINLSLFNQYVRK